jgi:hypothetical protein
MTILKEIRTGDINARAGVVVTNGKYILVAQPTNMIKNGWKLDLAGKGHIQKGETPIQAAIRECWEECNIKFEPWKLTHPIQTICDDDPLFLFYAKIDKLIPVNILSCASTFIDEDGTRKPEVEAYYWLNPHTQIHLMQKRLIPGIRHYFNSQKYFESENELSETKKEFENWCQTTGEIIGSTPPNINKILSLSYKGGSTLPLPKTIKKSQDYPSIPNF